MFCSENKLRRLVALLLMSAIFAHPLSAQTTRTGELEKERRLRQLAEAVAKSRTGLPSAPSAKPKQQSRLQQSAPSQREANRRAGSKPAAVKSEPPVALPAPAAMPTPTPTPDKPVEPIKVAPRAAAATPAANFNAQAVAGGGYTIRPVELNVNQWPMLRLDFSIERGDRAPFNGLTAGSVEANADGKPVNIAPDDLNFKSSASSGVLLVIDLSRSMTGGGSNGSGASKLDATKEAILSLIDSMSATDMIGIVAFDLSQRVVMEPTTNHHALKAAVRGLSVRSSGGGTALYNAADFALRYAEANKLGNVILLSDGCEHSAASKQHSRDGTLDDFKSQREAQIAEASRRAAIRVFTIAIGEQTPRSPLYVDAASLAHLTSGAPGGFSDFVDLPTLLGEAAGDGNHFSALLTGRLKTSLDRIRESFRYDYSLTLRDVAVGGGQPQKLTINFRVGNELLPMEIICAWNAGAQRPAVAVKLLKPLLIEAPAEGVSRWQLIKIFLTLLLALNLLALAPWLIEWFEGLNRRRRLRHAVVTLRGNSPLVGETCPNEGNGLGGSRRLKSGDVVVICPECKTTHHLACWELSKGRCWNRRCGHELSVATEPGAVATGWTS